MFKPLILGALLLCAAPAFAPTMATASTFASFDSSVGVTLSATPAQELYEGGGYLPTVPTIIQNGDVSLETGDDNGGTNCCSGGFWTGPGPTYMGEAALSATGSVHSVGDVHASGERLATWFFGNWGNRIETVTISFDIDLAISQAIDPLVGGIAGSGTEVTIRRDGDVIWTHALDGEIDEFALGTAYAEIFDYTFDVAPTNSISTVFDISVSGYVNAEVAPVPLPAGGLLLAAGLGAVGLVRRKRLV